jgi:hypothetical protein
LQRTLPMRCLLVAAVVTASCVPQSKPVTPAHGQLGVVDFYWAGVPTSRFAAGGANVPIVASGPSLALSLLSVTSSHPEVATAALVKSRIENIELTTGVPGTTALTLLDGSGGVIDRLDVTIVDVTDVRVMSGWAGDRPLVVEKTEAHLRVAPLAADGSIVIGWWALHVAAPGVLEQFSDERDNLGGYQDFAVYSATPGDTTLTLSGSAVRRGVPFSVVAGASVTRVDLSADHLYVTATAYAGDTPAYAQCAWISANATVHDSGTAATSVDLSEPPTTKSYLAIGTGDQATVTCTVGVAHASVDIHR